MINRCLSIIALGTIFFPLVSPSAASDMNSTDTPVRENVRFIGSVTCQSSMCHGGASPSRNQFTIWTKFDFHSRAYATLTTARSQRMAETLGLKSPAESESCTVCHAPFAANGHDGLAATAKVTEGVSCESCHNGAEAWLRSHTRPDWSYTDRVQAGLRDLKSVYVRANTCVRCHQVLDPTLVKAGHPELIFELDGQTASEPRHWTEKEDWSGPKAWLVGQAVALREISRQISVLSGDYHELDAQQKALAWLMSHIRPAHVDNTPGAPTADISPNAAAMAVATWGNNLARSFSDLTWNQKLSAENLETLAGTFNSFNDASIPLAERELRAERLVLGLDRLYKSLHQDPAAPGQAELTALFAAVQDRASFDSGKFASLLQKFAETIVPKK